MAKKNLRPQDIGRISKKVASIMLEKDLSKEKAFEDYLENDITKTMSKYDVKGSKKDILKEAESKINSLTSKISKKSKKKGKKRKKTVKKAEKPKKLAKILAVRVKGEVDVIEDDDGMKVKKIPKKTKSVAVFCEKGSHGELLDDETAGCVFD